MSRFYRALEKRFARFAVPNLTVIIIGCYVIGYILQLIRPGIAAYMTLEPALIVKGQVWRLVTWLVIPPGALKKSTQRDERSPCPLIPFHV